jgi:glycosyltransferase involved in cell wall biosynthesis
MIDVLIPTADRPDVIGLCLMALSSQTVKPARVIVYDNGSQPIFSDYKNRMIWDILTEAGIEMHYLRSNKREGLSRAREVLLRQVQSNDFMPLDDDALLEPDYIETLLSILGKNTAEAEKGGRELLKNFAGGLFLLPNNEVAKPDFSTQAYDEPPADAQEYQYAFFRYSKNQIIPIEYGGISGVIFRNYCVQTLLLALDGFPNNAPLEEFVQTRNVGNGLLVTKAVCWHLMSREQRRDWQYDLENVFRSRFQNEPKVVENFLKGKKG